MPVRDPLAAAATGETFLGMDVLFLTIIGRRIGQRRETPVVWFPDGADAWLIVASASGSTHDPAWYHNQAAHPDQVWIELPKRNLRVVPEQLEGARREACPLAVEVLLGNVAGRACGLIGPGRPGAATYVTDA